MSKDKHDNVTIDWVDEPVSRSKFKQQAKQLLTTAERDRLVEVLEQQLAQSNKLTRITKRTLAH